MTTLPDRECAVCGRTFHPRAKNAVLCPRAQCRRRYHNAAHRKWAADNREATRLYNRDWMARRRADPAYRERERVQQRDYRGKQ